MPSPTSASSLRLVESDVYLRAADLFEDEDIAHVCWAVAIADGYDSRQYLDSPAVREFQWMFADLEHGADILQSGDMLNAVEGDEAGFRELSLTLLALASAVHAEDHAAARPACPP